MRILVIMILAFFPAAAFAATGTKVAYTVNGENFEGYYISPVANAPLVFLVHDRDGLTDYEIKRASMMAELGYAVFCADMYGKGIRPTDRQEQIKLTRDLHADRLRIRLLLNGSLAVAKSQGANVSNAVAMGFSFGGTVVRELVNIGSEMNALIVFHDGLALPEELDYPEARVQVLVRGGFADLDTIMKGFGQMERGLEKDDVRQEMITSGGVFHAFTVYGSLEHRGDLEQKWWNRVAAFLAVTFKQ